MIHRLRPRGLASSFVVPLALAIALVSGPGAVSFAAHQSSHAGKATSIAQVRFIYLGLAVQAPHQKSQKGTLNMPLYNQYFLSTGTKQKASIRFKDGTMLHMNQHTDAVLQNPHVTVIKKGEVNEQLKPGTSHTVQTATAVAAAIGTRFDIKIFQGKKHKVRIVVVDGAVQVKTKKKTTVIKTNQEAFITGTSVSQPQHVNPAPLTNWTNGLPPAPASVGQNLALDANGGKIIAFSSQYSSPSQGKFWNVDHVNDGLLNFGWDSDVGQVTNQFVLIGFTNKAGNVYTARLTSVILDCAPTNGDTADESMKNFEIQVSTTGTDASSFTPVQLTQPAVCPQDDALHTFNFVSPVNAKYIKLVAKDNYGSRDWLTVAEFEAVGRPA